MTGGSKTYLICHGESLTISGIPVGAKWTITEDTPAGFVVTARVGEMTVGGSQTNGNILVEDTLVAYTNASTYELPDTGGTGTYLYTVGGMLLMAATIPLYSLYRKRRKEEPPSF